MLGGLTGATKIQMGGTTAATLLPSTGSGTARNNGQQGGHGLGVVLIPAITLPWSSLTAATGALTLGNGVNNTTFNQTSTAIWLWANTTASTLGTSQSSPLLEIAGTYFGSAAGALAASAADTWSLQNILATPTVLSGTAAITHISESAGSVVTLTLVGSTFLPLQQVILGGFAAGAGSWLNGYTVSLITSTGTTATFNDPTSHGTLVNTATTGTPTMTLASNLSTLTLIHSGSANTGALQGALGVAIPGATNLQIGTANSINGSLSLGFSGGAYSPTITAVSNGFSLTASGGVTVQATAGLNVVGSGGSTLGLATGATFTLGPASNVAVLLVRTSTAATSGQAQSAELSLQGNYWNGSASAADTWTLEALIGNGTNGASTLSIQHSGSSGVVSIQLPANSGAPTSTGTAGTAGQVLYNGANLYFCSVTGAAGSATWNKVNLTAV